MDSVDIQAINSTSFVFSRVMTPWASAYNLSQAVFRAYMRDEAIDNIVQYAWASDGSCKGNISFAQSAANGSITYVNNPSAGDTVTLGSTILNWESSSGGTQVTISVATPGVVTWTAHGLLAGQVVVFNTNGILPTGLTAGVPYYVLASGITLNSFQVAATPGGSAITTSGSPSGTPYGFVGNTVFTSSTPQGALVNLLAYLGASPDAQINLCNYTVQSDGLTLGIVYKTTNILGNLFEISASTGGSIVSGPTLYGGGGIITMTSSIGDLVNFVGDYVYDCRMEFGGPPPTSIVQVFGGTLTFTEAVTR